MNEKEENIYMNRNVVLICPDCNSHDLQEIVKDNTHVKKRGCIGGCLGLKDKAEKIKHRYYACRSCGREFESNKNQE